jgi:hypothetical protein
MNDAVLDTWDAPLSAEERDRLLDAAAQAVRKRGLEAPAIFALEMHRPFGYLAAHGALLFAPLLGPVLGIDRLRTLAQLLSDPAAVDSLIVRLEEAR